MYIVRRAAHVAGLAGFEWARQVTQVVQDAGVPVSLWMGGPGTVPGSVAWSVMVDSVEQWFTMTEPLLADPAYQQASAAGRDVIIGFERDRLIEVVHGAIDGPTEVGGYLGVIEATTHPDRTAEAGAFAVEVADAWSAATGLGAVVATNAAGEMGTITWLARHTDAASIDAANAKVATSASYAEVLARGAGLFTDGVQGYARRIA